MPRKRLINKRTAQPDPVYGSILLTQYVGKLIQEGKKDRAITILYKSLEMASEKTKMKPIEVLETATDRCRPLVEVRPRRIGGATYQIPTEVVYEKGVSLAIKWIVTAARKKKGKPMVKKLSEEFVDSVNKTGDAFKKREDAHRMAEANKAFAHLKW
jgi:small subunit ribosomal protein S7